MKKEICNRLAVLRSAMRNLGVAALIVPSTDPHAGEYVPEHWKTRAWITGFTGSAGTAVITLNGGGLWADSRYWLQAEAQLEGTGIEMIKDRLPETPTIPAWLSQVLTAGDAVAIEGWVNTIAQTDAIKQELKAYGLNLFTAFNEIDNIWTDRPAMPDTAVEIQPLEFAGQACREKLAVLRQKMKAIGADGLMVSGLDEIAWTLNIRGGDVHCNPVVISYLLITKADATLFVAPHKVTVAVAEYLQGEGVTLAPYTAVSAAMQAYPYETIAMDPARTNYAVREALSEGVQVLYIPSLIMPLKAVKNEAEMSGFRRCMEYDGAAMVKFLKWLEASVPAGGQTEMSIDRYLCACRAEQPLFRGISFDTIAGYKEHAAIVHYVATPETDKTLEPEGLLLVDSGGQYQSGTTDITRTIALGPTTDEEKHDYTMVLKAHIGMSRFKFLDGTCGTQIDIMARGQMWQAGLNYLHGTGHGVGSYLSVHEGPHQVRMNHVPAPLRTGMTATDEPGLYKEGRHGIRIENTLLTVPFITTEFGEFYQFEPLTLCPIDTVPIVREMLTAEEVVWLNDYHQTVYNRLSPLLDEEHRIWLKEKTKAI